MEINFLMTSDSLDIDFGQVVHVDHPGGTPEVIVVCEHASNRIPDGLNGLGLTPDIQQSHVAWDPGAEGVARHLARTLSASLVLGAVSRLVYDCNRPPDAESAIPEKSEIHDIPGNCGLSPEDRARRVNAVYWPFTTALAAEIERNRRSLRLMVTVHSFTPVFQKVRRDVEMGILHGFDADFAQTMLQYRPKDFPFTVRLNEPYSARDGVVHTLDRHGTSRNLWNVMIEIRNDLIATGDDQQMFAELLAPWINGTLQHLSEASP